MVKKVTVEATSSEAPVQVIVASEAETTTEDEQRPTVKSTKKGSVKNVSYTDDDNVIVPKRKIKLSRIFDVYCVKHNAEINIEEHETVCRTDWNAQLVAREFCVSELEKEKKVTGRRDIFVRERGISSVKTYGYVVRRKRVEEKDVKKVQFPGKSDVPATFNFNTNVNHARINKAHLRSFRQQCMKRLGATDSEIENVPLEADKKDLGPESDSEPEEDAPEPKVKAVKKKKEVSTEGDVATEPAKVSKKAASKADKTDKVKKTKVKKEAVESNEEENTETVEESVPKKAKGTKKKEKKAEQAEQPEEANDGENIASAPVTTEAVEKPKVKKSKKKVAVAENAEEE